MASGFRRRRATPKQKLRAMMDRAEEKLAEGLHYEALQMIKALASRYAAAQTWDAAIDLLQHGALKMIKYKQARCVLDLGDTLLNLGPDLSTSTNMKLADAVVIITSSFYETSPQNLTFINDALRWSQKADLEVIHPNGLPALHLVAAKAHLTRGDTRSATRHFVCAEAPDEFARMTMAQAKKGFSSECDLFITRSLLRLLAAGSGVDAGRTFLSSCATQWRSRSSNADKSPLVHFCEYLLQALELPDSLPLFQVLRNVYAPTLARDPSLNEMLTRISNQYYNTPMPQRAAPRNSPFGNPMLANMMKMMGPMMSQMGGRR